NSDDLSDLLSSRGKYNDVRSVFEKGKSVAFVNQKLGFVIDNRGTVKDLPQLAGNFILHGFVTCSLSFLICSFTNVAWGLLGFVSISFSQYSRALCGSFFPCNIATPRLNKVCASLGLVRSESWNVAIASSYRF